MKIDDLKIFNSVVELGGFTAAATALDIPKSSVSRRINKLEKDLGVALFFRTTRSLSLTQYGKAYHREVVKALEALERARQVTTNIHQLPTGRIKIGLLAETDDEVCTALYAFQNIYPDIELDIQTISNGFVDVIQRDLDIAFHYGDIIDCNLVAKKLPEFERVLLASPEYVERFGSPKNLDELPQHNCLCYRYPNGKLDNAWQFSGKEVLVSGDICSNSCGIIKRTALAGRGIAHLPRSICKEEFADGRLLNILPDFKPDPYIGWLLYQESKGISRGARLLIDFLTECAENIE